MSRRAPLRIAGLAAALLVAGCQANPDPATGGFVDGLVGLGGGTYDQRVQDRQTRAAATRAEADRLTQRAIALGAERDALAVEEAVLNERLRQVDGRLAGIRRDLERARTTRDTDQAQLRQRQRELADLEQRRAILQAAGETGGEAETQAELAALETDVEAMRRAVAALLGTTVVE